ncbi:MAG: transposase [Gemmatimonadaceae bacterium]
MGKKRRIRREFTAEFRTEAVQLMMDRLREGTSLTEIGRGIDVEPYLLRRWAR